MLRWLDLLIYWFSKQVMRHYLASGLTIHVQGLERIPERRAAILVANHPCAIDGWLLICLIQRKLSFFIRAEHFAHPFANWYVRMMGGLPVRSRADNRASLAVAEAVLRRNHLFAIFPEGNVTPGPTLLPFQSSAIHFGLDGRQTNGWCLSMALPAMHRTARTMDCKVATTSRRGWPRQERLFGKIERAGRVLRNQEDPNCVQKRPAEARGSLHSKG